MTDADRNRLQKLLTSLDEAALIGLANKGLLRRALKDLEAGGVSHDEEEAGLVVRGPGWKVRMPPTGPADAEDDTRATGVTRHVLAATLYLQNAWAASTRPQQQSKPVAEESEPGELRNRLLALAPEQLQRWAGKRAIKRALDYLRNDDVHVSCEVGVAVRFEKNEVDARLLDDGAAGRGGAILDRFVTTAPKAVHREWVVASVLALWRDAGVNVDKLVDAAEMTPTRRTGDRSVTLTRAVAALEAVVSAGAAHPSTGAVEQFFALSISARAGDLPRLARLLRSIADQLALIEARDIKGDAERLLSLVALTHALAKATVKAGPAAPVSLTGRHHSGYDGRGDLALAGLGAYPWRTASGYEGLTVLLWDPASQSIRTWTESRPIGSPDRFSPVAAYKQAIAWETLAPATLCRSNVRLVGAKWNDAGRLSLTCETAQLGQETALDDLEIGSVSYDSWDKLAEHVHSICPLGLRDSQPESRLVVLWPSQWGQRVFNETQQRFAWDVLDSKQRVVRLSLPWTEATESAIEFLEVVKPEREKLAAVVVRIDFTADGLSFEPLSLLARGSHAVLNPAFDSDRIRSQQTALLKRLREKFQRSNVMASLESEADELDRFASLDGLPPRISRLFADTGSALQAIGESGVRSTHRGATDRLKSNAATLARLGLAELAAAVRMCTADHVAAGDLLACCYLQTLHVQAARQTVMFGTDSVNWDLR